MKIKTITLLVAMTAAASNAASVVIGGSFVNGTNWQFSGTGITSLNNVNEATPTDPSVLNFVDAATGVAFTIAVTPVGGSGWNVATGGVGIEGNTNGNINADESIDIVFSNEVGVLGPITISDGVFNTTDIEISGNSIVHGGSGSGRLQGFTVNYTAIPEPSTGLLAGLAGLALVARRRR